LRVGNGVWLSGGKVKRVGAIRVYGEMYPHFRNFLLFVDHLPMSPRTSPKGADAGPNVYRPLAWVCRR